MLYYLASRWILSSFSHFSLSKREKKQFMHIAQFCPIVLSLSLILSFSLLDSSQKYGSGKLPIETQAHHLLFLFFKMPSFQQKKRKFAFLSPSSSFHLRKWNFKGLQVIFLRWWVYTLSKNCGFQNEFFTVRSSLIIRNQCRKFPALLSVRGKVKDEE